MIAKDIISKEIPFLILKDNGNRAIDIMENYLVSNLPIVDENDYIGLVSLNDIYNFDLFDEVFENFKKPLQRAYVYENQHYFDVIKSFSIYQTSILPVLDSADKFYGVITQKSLIDSMSKILCISEEGYHLKFTLNHNDFSATEISNIVEKNDSKITSLYVDNHETTEIDVYLKIYTKDIEAVMQSFERYNYNATLLNKEENDYTEFYQERLDNFMNYLNI